jgi:hypothetical protein
LFLYLNTIFEEVYSRLPSQEQLLQSLAYKPVKANPRKFLIGCNVSDSIKNRLLYLLNWQWTKEELDEYLAKDLSDHVNLYNISKRAKLVSRNSDSLYKIAYDSFHNIIIKENLQYLEQSQVFNVHSSIILTVAFLNMKESIPQLKTFLNDKKHYDIPSVELALAKFGDNQLQRKIINECMPVDKLDGFEWLDDFTSKARKLVLIGTQESYYNFNAWLDTTKTIETIAGKPLEKSSYRVLAYLRDFILNKDFQELVKPVPLDASCPCNNDLVSLARKWLTDNKGRYEINQNLYPW